MSRLEQRLSQIAEEADSPEINELAGYIFNNAGKRLRPALFLLAAYRPGKSLVGCLDIAVALETIHTASLVHDDVIDQASIRRGKGSVNARWNNKISVLAGDYLLSRAFKLLVSCRDWRIMEVVVDLVGKMTGGEIEQAFAEPGAPGLEERYFQWIGKKSASFFAGCCKAGCLVAGANDGDQAVWTEYGFNLGIAFQLIDDLLDYTGEDGVTGKPVYGDLQNRVATLPLIRTIDLAWRDGSLNQLLVQEPVAQRGREFLAAAQSVLDSDGPEYTFLRAEEYANKALAVLQDLRDADPGVVEILSDLTTEVLNRKK